MLSAPIPFVPRTKLRPPRLPDDVLLRTRLLARLDRPQTLTLIVAPAGYGKTTLAATWLAQCGRPGAWISLESDDNTPAAFLLALVTAVRRMFPAFGGELLDLLQDPTCEQTPAQVLPILLNDLDKVDQDFVLVLDDYHHIVAPSIHKLTWELLAHPPRPLHLVLTARHDPPIPPRIRLRGTVTEIRAHELCFTAAETHEFLNQFGEQPLDAQSIALFVQQSEGWAVPMRLAGILLMQRQSDACLDSALRECQRSLLDYLEAEVIGDLPVDVQTFLTYTSILSQLTGSLCDAVIGETHPGGDSAATLRILADAGIFVERLDDGDWFRYHELFRTLLLRRLRRTHAPQAINVLYQRASTWYEQHNLHDDGVTRDLSLDRMPVASVPNKALNQALIAVSPRQRTVTHAEFPGTPYPQAPKWSLNRMEPGPLPAQRTQAPAYTGRDLRDLLTFREMDVLLLLNQRLTNKEIAHTLAISMDTVRQHTVKIYRKLGVANRRQAIVQADTLGLLSGGGS